MNIFSTANRAIWALSKDVLTHGDKLSPRGKPTLNLDDVTFEVIWPEWSVADQIGRKLSPAVAGAEALQLIGGFSDSDAMAKIAPAFTQYMDNNILMGAYGPRVSRYIPDVIRKLKDDPATRQAVIHIYDNNDLVQDPPYRDVPCTQSLHFRIRNGKLDLVVRMRSSDVHLGLPYDIIQFTQLQHTVATCMGMQAGTYVHQSASLHVYVDDIEKVRAYTAPEHDPSGSQKLFGIGANCPAYSHAPWYRYRDRARKLFYGTVTPNDESEAWLAESVTQKLFVS
jgi:thymidylate synthase